MKKKELDFKEKVINKLNKLMKNDINGELLDPVTELKDGTYLIFNEIKTDIKGLSAFAEILKKILK